MTLIIELTSIEEARLQAASQKRGVEPGEYARQLIADLPPGSSAPPKKAGMERDPELVARVKSLRGKYAHLGVTTQDLHRERQEDKAKEEAQFQRHTP